MKRLNYLVVLSILGALIMAMVAIVSASADAPEHSKFFWEGDFNYTECGPNIPIHVDLQYEYTLFKDKNGEAYGDAYHYGGSKITFTYNGHTLTLHGASQERWTWIFYSETYTLTLGKISGASWIGTIPGHGPVWGTVGMQDFLETCTGQGEDQICQNEYYHWSGMEFFDQEAVCNYLLNGK